MKQDKKDLTTGSIPKKLTSLTVPMMLGIISLVAFNLVDTYFVGKLGSLQLAALSFTFPVILVIFGLVQGLGTGTTALISKSIGKNDRVKAARETTDSVFLSVLISGLFIMVGLLTVKPTFKLLGASDEILPYVTEYMTIWYFALFFVTVPFVGNSAIRATGDTLTPSMIMVFSVIVNAILDPLLIFGYGPFPELGLAGAAYATAISRGMTMVLSFLVLNYREKLIVRKIPSWPVIWKSWKGVLYIAIPSSFSRMIVPVFTGLITAMLADYGEFAVAAYGVGTRIEFLAMSVLFALSASIGPFTGQNFGLGNYTRIRTGINYANIFSIAWGIVAAVVLYFAAEPVAAIFTSDKKIIEATTLFLTIVPIGFGFRGVVQVVNSNINTLNKPLYAFLIVVLQMLVIGIPILYLGDYLFEVKGIYLAIAFTYFIGAVISFFWNQKIIDRMVATEA